MPGEDITVEIGNESDVILEIPQFEDLVKISTKISEMVKNLSDKITNCCEKIGKKLENISKKIDTTNKLLGDIKLKIESLRYSAAAGVSGAPATSVFRFKGNNLEEYTLGFRDIELSKRLAASIINRYDEATQYMKNIVNYLPRKEQLEATKLSIRAQIEQMRYQARLIENAGKTQRMILNNLSTIDGRIRAILNEFVSSFVVSNRKEYEELREKIRTGKGLTSEEMQKYLKYEEEINNTLLKVGKYAAFLVVLTQISSLLRGVVKTIGEMLIYTLRAFVDSLSMFLIPIIQMLKYILLFSWAVAKPYMKAMADILSSNESATQKLVNLAEIQLIQWIDLLGQTIILGFGIVTKPIIDMLSLIVKGLTGVNFEPGYYSYLSNAAKTLHTTLLKAVGITPSKNDVLGDLLNKIYGGLGSSNIFGDVLSTTIGQSVAKAFTVGAGKVAIESLNVNIPEDGLKGLKDQIVRILTKAFTEFLDKSRSSFIDLLSDLKTTISDLLKNAFNIRKISGFLVGGLKASGLDYIFTSILKGFGGVSSTGAAYISQWLLRALGFERFAVTNPLAFTGVSALITFIKSVLEGKRMSEVAWEELKQSVESLNNHYQKFYNAFQEVVRGNILSVLNMILEGIWIIVDSIGVVINTIVFIGSKIVDTILDVLNEIKNIILGAISKIVDFVSAGAKGVMNVGGGVVRGAASLAGGVVGAVESVSNGLAENVNNVLSSVWTALSKGAEGIENTAKSFLGLKTTAETTSETIQKQAQSNVLLSSVSKTVKIQTDRYSASLGLVNFAVLTLLPNLVTTNLKIAESSNKHKMYAKAIDIVSKSIVASAEYMFSSLERYINKTKEYYDEYKRLKEEYERKLEELREREKKTVTIKIDSDILGNHTFTI